MLDGSYDEHEDGTPLPTAAGTPNKPGWLAPVAAKVWDQVVAELGDIDGLLSPLDGPVLACYCHAHQRLAEARDILAREGLILDGRRHPALMIESKCIEQIVTIGKQFGLSPTSRASLRINPQTQAESELDELLR